jgi:hypothetical protein
MEPGQEPQKQDALPQTQTPQPLGPSPAVREVLYRAVALGLVIIIGIAVLVYAAVTISSAVIPGLVAGHPPLQPPVSPAETTALPTVALPPTTAPVEFLPPGMEVTVLVEPKSSAGVVTINFIGGAGRGQIKEIQARLTGSDGTMKTGSLDPHTISPQIVLQGTRGTDQLEVFALMYSGKIYKILDKNVPFVRRY